MNYEELLRKYIAHVLMYEGIDFLGTHERYHGMFTDEEWAELNRVAGKQP